MATMTETTQATHVRLLGACVQQPCQEMAWQLHNQLARGGYGRGASAMPMPDDFNAYLLEHNTARRRAGRCARAGYRFAEIDRHKYEDDINAVNTSLPNRQGRPMSEAYQRPHTFGPNDKLCDRHHVYPYAILRDDHLVAYLWLYRSGGLAMVSSILGHADHLKREVMYLLVTEAVRDQMRLGGTMFYNIHASGTDGLRWFKERLGFQSTEVAWLL